MTTPRAVSTPDEERLHKSVEAAQRWLLEDQHPEGFWWGELESNTSITSEYLLLTHHLGIGDPERWAEIAAYLRGKQSAEGYWSQYYDGPGEISTTIETYFALKLAGEDPDAPHMVRAVSLCSRSSTWWANRCPA